MYTFNSPHKQFINSHNSSPKIQKGLMALYLHYGGGKPKSKWQKFLTKLGTYKFIRFNKFVLVFQINHGPTHGNRYLKLYYKNECVLHFEKRTKLNVTPLKIKQIPGARISHYKKN